RMRAADATKLLDCYHKGHGVETGTFVLLRNRHAQEAEPRHLRDGRFRKLTGLVDVGRDRPDFLLREVPRGLTNHLVFGRQVELHRFALAWKGGMALRASPRRAREF